MQPVGVLAAREAAPPVAPAELGLEPVGDGPGAASDPDGPAVGVVEGEAQTAVAEQAAQGSLGNRGAIPARAHPARRPLRLVADPVVRFIGLGVGARVGIAGAGIAGVGGGVVRGPVPTCGVTVVAVVGVGGEGGDGDMDDDFGPGPAGVGADFDQGVGAASVERFAGGGERVGVGVSARADRAVVTVIPSAPWRWPWKWKVPLSSQRQRRWRRAWAVLSSSRVRRRAARQAVWSSGTVEATPAATSWSSSAPVRRARVISQPACALLIRPSAKAALTNGNCGR